MAIQPFFCHNISMLRIRLFGLPAVFKDDVPVLIKRRTTRALLFYLAAFGKPVHRETLMELFWPDEPLEKARLALTDTLSKLRSDLKEKGSINTFLPFIALNSQLVEVDWLKIRDLAKQINKQLGATKPDQALNASLHQNMTEALAIWHSAEFIENDDVAVSPELENWLAGIRADNAEFFLRLLTRLAAHETLTGNLDQAIHFLTQALEFDEYSETLNRNLIEAYLNAQRSSEAREHYEAVKALYEADGDGEIPEILLALKPRLTLHHTVSAIAENPNWSIQPGLPVPFIGQKEALTELINVSKRGGAVIVLGDGGSGKTRLVHEFCRRLGAGTRLLVASCQPLETGMPFAPWVSLLRASMSEEDWRQLDVSWAAPLSMLFPELHALRTDLHLPPSEIPRTVLMEAGYQLLSQLTQKNMLILFMDDAHWADESSLALVSYLLKKSFFRPGRSLLILSARTEEKNSMLDKFLMAPHPEQLRRINTQLFTRENLAELCYFAFSRAAPPEFVEKLYQDTGGNEFFSIQILQAFWEENPNLDFGNVASLPIPLSITDAIQRKFNALSRPARDVIITAVVLGSQFEISMLEAAVSLSADEYLLALEELEQARIIHPLHKGNGSFGFVHEKLREGLLLQLNQNRKRLLHRKVALALESYLSTNIISQASLLAYHFEEGGMHSKAFDAWVLAAEHAWRLMSTYEAMDACRRAERLILRAGEVTEEQIYKMYRVWNEIAFQNDDFKTLETLNQTLQTLGKDLNSNLLIGAALTGLSDAEMSRNQFGQALEYVQQAFGYLQKTDNSYEKARALERWGVYEYMLGHIRESQPYFLRALELTQGAADFFSLIERGTSFYQLAITETLRGYPLIGLEHARQSLQAQQQARNIYGQIVAYSVIGLANFLVSNYASGLEACLRGIELASRVDGWRMYGYLCSYAAFCETEMGLVDDAWEHAQKAIEIGYRQGHGEIVGLGYRVVGHVYFHLGAIEKASEAYQQGMSAAGQHFVALENMYRFGYTLTLMGQEIGRHYLTQAINTAWESELGSIAILGTFNQLAVHLIRGEQAEFEERAKWLKELVLERAKIDVTGNFNRMIAEHAFKQGDYQRALTLAQPSIKLYSQFQVPWYELSCLRIVEQSSRQLGLELEPVQLRIDELLAKLESSLQKAPLQAEWQNYRTRIAPE